MDIRLYNAVIIREYKLKAKKYNKERKLKLKKNSKMTSFGGYNRDGGLD